MRRKAFTLLIGTALVTFIASPMDVKAQAKPKKGAPPSTASVHSGTTPPASVQLERIHAGAEGTVWLDLGSVVLTGDSAEYWMLSVPKMPMPSPSGASASAVWNRVAVQCAAGTASPRHIAMVDAGGQIIQQAAIPPQPFAAPPSTSPVKAVTARACNTAAKAAPPLATNVVTAATWSRDERAWASAVSQARAAAAPPQSSPAGSPPGSAITKVALAELTGTEPAPSIGNGVFDWHISSAAPAGFHSRYVTEDYSVFDMNQWTFLPFERDRQLDINGKIVTAQGAWFRWAIDCEAKTVANSDVHLLLADGTTTRGPVSPQGPIAADGWRTPRGNIGRELADKACVDDMVAMLDANIAKGLLVASIPDLRTAVALSRRAAAPSVREVGRARECSALATAALRLESGMEMWASVGWTGRLLATGNVASYLLRAAPADPAADQVAIAKASARIAAVPNRTADLAIATELDTCLADLPLAVLPGQFSDLVTGQND